MTEKEILSWIKVNLGPLIQKAFTERKNTIYTEDWIAAMIYRETGFLIGRYVTQKVKFQIICELMKGDYGQRPGEAEKQYHGFGFLQIDIKSFPDFVRSGNWKNPYLTILKAIDVLESKRKYLETKPEPTNPEESKDKEKEVRFPFLSLTEDQKQRAITAAYNTGEGNVFKSILIGRNVDATTYNKDYSKEVWRFRDIYRTLA